MGPPELQVPLQVFINLLGTGDVHVFRLAHRPEQGTVLRHGVNLVRGVAKSQQEQEGKVGSGALGKLKIPDSPRP